MPIFELWCIIPVTKEDIPADQDRQKDLTQIVGKPLACSKKKNICLKNGLKIHASGVNSCS